MSAIRKAQQPTLHCRNWGLTSISSAFFHLSFSVRADDFYSTFYVTSAINQSAA